MMRSAGLILTVISSAVLAQSLESEFQQARTLELVHGNVAGATEIYEGIIEFDGHSKTQALALLEVGRLYHSSGRRVDAKSALQRIVAEYPAEADIVARAQQRLVEYSQILLGVPYTEDYQGFAISPDGSRLVYAVMNSGSGQLWMYDILTDERHPLAGGTLVRATYEFGSGPMALPFWSPDGESIGFFSSDKLKVIDAVGGSPRTVVEVKYPRGASWGRGSTIIYAATPDGRKPAHLFSIAADGSSDSRELPVGEGGCPQFLPDGRRFLMFRDNTPFIWAASLDTPETTLIDVKGFTAMIVAPNRLMHVPEGELFEQRLDMETLEPIGDPQRIAASISGVPGIPCLRGVSASAAGAVATKPTRGILPSSKLVLRARNGSEIYSSDEDVRPACCIRLSPDGMRALWGRSGNSPNGALWIAELEPGGDTRPVFVESRYGVWSPDGGQIAVGIDRAAGPDGPGHYLEVVRLRDSATLQRIAVAGARFVDYSRDGRYLLYEKTEDRDLYALPAGDFGPLAVMEPMPVATTPAIEQRGRISPDSRWVAFQSDEAGARFEIFVQPLSGAQGERRQISVGGGTQPAWRGDGGELYFLSADFEIMAVPVTYSDSGDIEPGTAVPLFGVPPSSNFDASVDGQRFLIHQFTDTERFWPIIVKTE